MLSPPPRVVRLVDQRLAQRIEVRTPIARSRLRAKQNLGDIGIGQLASQPVRRQQVQIPILRFEVRNLRLDHRLRTHRARNDVAHRVRRRLFRRHLPRAHMLLDQRVVVRLN